MTDQDPILLMAVAADGGILPLLVNFLPFVAIFVLFYFLLIRPQQKRMKAHQELVSSVKRGDTIVLSSGMIAKVTRVEAEEVMAEIAQGVNVRVVKTMITEVRGRTAPAIERKAKSAKA
ncbi:preprotein translocase subunit YajC [Brevundimonas poindexterae]|uniref:preprotein translocase subunit YajC n=1 Tax=Brevundimonas poindexterae TaxID=74325 RepID=UPI0038515145